MNDPIIHIDASYGSLYPLFKIGGYWISFLILMYLGYRRKYPLLPFLIIILAARLTFMIGSRLGSVDEAQWSQLLAMNDIQNTVGQSVWGGILLAIPAIILTCRILSFKYPVFSLYVIAVPFGLAFQRIGCLLAGCCFGKPTTQLWGIAYSEGTFCYHSHAEYHLIELGDSFSLLVHPAPLYLIIGYLCTGFTLVWLSTRIQNQGKLLIAALGLLSSFRFVSEFFRDSASNLGMQGIEIGPFTLIQVICLIISIISILAFLRLESSANFRNASSQQLTPAIVTALGLVMVAILFQGLFDAKDRFLLNVLFIFLLFAIGWKIWNSSLVPVPKWVLTILLVGPMWWMGQASVGDTLNLMKEPGKRNVGLISVGGGINNYSGKSVSTHSGCFGGSYTSSREWEGRRSAILVGYEHRFYENAKDYFSLGVNFHVGSLYQYYWRSTSNVPPYTREIILTNQLQISPMIALEQEEFGIRVGVPIRIIEKERIGLEYQYLPSVHLRFLKESFFLEAGMLNHTAMGFFSPALVNAGIGFTVGDNQVSPAKIRIGVGSNLMLNSIDLISMGGYASAEFDLFPGFRLSPYVFLGGQPAFSLMGTYHLSRNKK